MVKAGWPGSTQGQHRWSTRVRWSPSPTRKKSRNIAGAPAWDAYPRRHKLKVETFSTALQMYMSLLHVFHVNCAPNSPRGVRGEPSWRVLSCATSPAANGSIPKYPPQEPYPHWQPGSCVGLTDNLPHGQHTGSRARTFILLEAIMKQERTW